jgi:asparagine synthase (glutamine-hydrolysing)
LAQQTVLLSEVLAPDARAPDGAEAEAVSRYFDERFFTPGRGIVQDFEKHFMNVDRQSWLVDESLARTDKMTMAFGLEERVPILDERLVELAYRIPSRWKVPLLGQMPSRFQGKRIWLQALSPYLPAHIRRERKRGWFTPMAKWLRSPPFSDLVEAVLSPRNLHPGFFDSKGVHRVWRDHREGKRYNLNVIWAILSWQLWYDRFVKGGNRSA